VFVLDTLLLGGIKFVLSKIAAAVDAELDDETILREELLAAQMQLELGQISDEEFAAVERGLFDAIREIRARRREAEEAEAPLKVTGIEADVWSGHETGEDEEAGRSGR
jgi:hypothetical protein